ncbi:DNA polymerase [Alphaproteobacteria bacterium]|nr:DNA polymerase [Alphaproteobacteria bacterium]
MNELREMEQPPFNIGSDALFVAYFASAEFSVFLALGWNLPANIFDCYAEFRCQTNGETLPFGNGQLGALQYFGITDVDQNAKDDIRQCILTGGPWSPDERIAILDYCQSDVDGLAKLFTAMLARWPIKQIDLEQALVRGRYVAAVAQMEHRGVPIDVKRLGLMQDNWHHFKQVLIEETDQAYGIYEHGSFRTHLFERYLTSQNIAWPRLPSGELQLDRDTFKMMALRYPRLAELRELRKTLAEMREIKLTVGKDGRNRTLLSPFQSKTGRNQPSTTRFIFGLPAWARSLIKPEPGTALAYLDFSSQEIAIAACLSGDDALWQAYASGDPYIQFAIDAGLAPVGATKQSHKSERDACKVIMLGVQYGMSAYGMGQKAGLHVLEAENMLQRHKDVYHTFWKWADQNVNAGLAGIELHTIFGWKIRTGKGRDVKENTFLNWPMQANGAEMLRLACIALEEDGIGICAPVHDAILIEAPLDEIDTHVALATSIMQKASEWVLGRGRQCRVDAEIVRWPDRYIDGRGTNMWSFIQSRLGEEAA